MAKLSGMGKEYMSQLDKIAKQLPPSDAQKLYSTVEEIVGYTKSQEMMAMMTEQEKPSESTIASQRRELDLFQSGLSLKVKELSDVKEV